MIGTFANSIATSLWSRTHTLKGNAFVNKHFRNEEFANFSFTIIFRFPITDSRTQKFLYRHRSCFCRKAKRTKRTINLHTTNHIHNITHFTR